MAKKTADDEVKPANDAYTGMLVISLLALLTGCALLFLDYNQYPEKAPKAAKFLSAPQPGAPAPAPPPPPPPPPGNQPAPAPPANPNQ
jgi:hypothetical protein